MTCMPIRMGISRRPLTIRDPTFANELNRPASMRLLRRTIAAACARGRGKTRASCDVSDAACFPAVTVETPVGRSALAA
jgi:hypothetical protein